jgi:hypothetical protein
MDTQLANQLMLGTTSGLATDRRTAAQVYAQYDAAPLKLISINTHAYQQASAEGADSSLRMS